MSIETEDRCAAAFNWGADARLSGRPAKENPYPPHTSESLSWLRGWRDVEQHYGEESRWPVPPLPEILKGACP